MKKYIITHQIKTSRQTIKKNSIMYSTQNDNNVKNILSSCFLHNFTNIPMRDQMP